MFHNKAHLNLQDKWVKFVSNYEVNIQELSEPLLGQLKVQS